MTGRLRWRKKVSKELYRGPEMYVLTDGVSEFMHVQRASPRGGYFWYGKQRNTAGSETDLATAKAEALQHYKDLLKK